MCNHAAVAAFLNSHSNKNNNENELFPLHARDGIKIVDRYIIPVNLQIQVPGTRIERVRSPDLSNDSRLQIVVYQCSRPGDRQKCVAISHGWRCVNVGTGAAARLNRRQIV